MEFHLHSGQWRQKDPGLTCTLRLPLTDSATTGSSSTHGASALKRAMEVTEVISSGYFSPFLPAPNPLPQLSAL